MTGYESASNGDYQTGYNKAKTQFIDYHKLTYPALIEDENDTLSVMLGIIGAVPYNVIINGVPNDPNYEQWEMIYKSAGFPYNNPTAEMQYVEMYRSYIDKVTTTDNPILRLNTNQALFFPGDMLDASLRVKYYGQLPSADLYTALLVFGNLYFYPVWGKNPAPTSLHFTYGYDDTIELLKDIPVSQNLPEGTYSLLAISTESGTLNPISPLSRTDFRISHATKGSMRAYFKENTVYLNPDDGKWAFTVYLENTGDFDITINEFVGEWFDADGNSLGTQDVIKYFHAWFKLLGRILPAGVTSEANLTVDLNDQGSGGAEFYFKGLDSNEFEVETRSERLGLLPAK